MSDCFESHQGIARAATPSIAYAPVSNRPDYLDRAIFFPSLTMPAISYQNSPVGLVGKLGDSSGYDPHSSGSGSNYSCGSNCGYRGGS